MLFFDGLLRKHPTPGVLHADAKLGLPFFFLRHTIVLQDTRTPARSGKTAGCQVPSSEHGTARFVLSLVAKGHSMAGCIAQTPHQLALLLVRFFFRNPTPPPNPVPPPSSSIPCPVHIEIRSKKRVVRRFRKRPGLTVDPNVQATFRQGRRGPDVIDSPA